MKTRTFIALMWWAICLISTIEIGCAFVSMADTVFNAIGLITMIIFAFISYKTKCFTNIKITKK